MLAPYWVLFVLLCPHFYQIDSQQSFKIIYEFLIKLKPFVLKHCKKASHYTVVSTILGPIWFIVSSFSSIWFATAFQNHLWIFSKNKKSFVLKRCKKASHYTGVSTILGPIWFIVSSFSSIWFATAFQNHLWIFSKNKKPFVLKRCKKASHYTGVSTILGPIRFIVSSFLSNWFATIFQNHLRFLNKIKTFCSKALQKSITLHCC